MPRGKSYFLQGQQGGVVLNSSSSTPVAPYGFRGVLAIEDSDISLSLGGGPPLDGYDIDANDVTLEKGRALQCKFDGISVTSGTVIAYYD
jgi:hypothetical protein